MYQLDLHIFHKKLFRALLASFLLFAIISPPFQSVHAAEIALVIDDLGYNLEVGKRVLKLPGPVALSLIPFTPNAHALSQLAQDAGQDILLHLPMEAIHSTDHQLEHVLELGMTLDNFQSSLNLSLNALPNCIGVNNHTGSLLTQHREPMEWLMGTIQDRGLFFLDSRTTPLSLANTIALEWGVPSIKRDVFLDHEPGAQALNEAFSRAIKIAKSRGYAVIIAHPHKGSLKFLERALPELAGHSIELVHLRDLMHRRPVLASTTVVKTSHPVAPAPLTSSGSAHTALGL